MKKTVFTLNINGYSKGITELTYPLLKYYANKIGADFYVITDRKFPDWPLTYEKLQIYELGQEMKNDWNIYIDSDAIIHPETVDWTVFLNKDMVAHNGSDMANVRWRYDKYFYRDGRNIGSCNWFTVGSDWCIDLWHPLDISIDIALKNIYPTVNEYNTVITVDHLIDDYTLSRNIARYGLKFTTLKQLQINVGMADAEFSWHDYTDPIDVKIVKIKEVLDTWRIPKFIREYKCQE
jgi:hypothetical protein